MTTFCHVAVVVDGVYTDRSHTAGSVAILASSRVFVGGSDDTGALPGSKQDANFVGCLRKVCAPVPETWKSFQSFKSSCFSPSPCFYAFRTFSLEKFVQV